MSWQERFARLCDGQPMSTQTVDEAARLAAISDPDRLGESFWRLHLRIVQIGIMRQLRNGATIGGLFRHMARRAGELADQADKEAECHF